MAFSDFVYPDVLTAFALTEDSADLFAQVPDLAPSDPLRAIMPNNRELANLMNTEKARSELLVAPLLSELWRRFPRRLNLHSGVEFAADPEERLTGFVDFIVGRGPQLPRISPPVLVAFEAKRDSIADGYGQCIAAMVGAQRYNRRANQPIDPVYGCVTTGSVWKFLRLRDRVVSFDTPEYSIHEIDRLLGILAFITVPAAPAVAA
jgi:hypothetical protein